MILQRTVPQWDRIEFPVALRPVLTKTGEGKLKGIPGTQCVYREDTGQVLDIVSSRYRLLPHGDVFRPLDEIVRNQMPYDLEGVRTRVGLDGGYAAVEWEFDHEVQVREDDAVRLCVIATNSMNRSAALRLELSARRLLCSNGLRGPGPDFSTQWKHHVDELSFGDVERWLEEIPARVAPMFDVWKEWTERRVFVQRLEEFLETDSRASHLIGKSARSRIMGRLPDEGTASLWEAYNALTWYASHGVRTRKPANHAIRQEDVQSLALKFADTVEMN